LIVSTGSLTSGTGTQVVAALAKWSEVAVGGSLLVVGALGINEARTWTWQAPTPAEVTASAEMRVGWLLHSCRVSAAFFSRSDGTVPAGAL